LSGLLFYSIFRYSIVSSPPAVKEEKKMIESNNVATLNVGRDPAVKEEKKRIESNNVATLNVGRDPAVKEEKKMIESNNVQMPAGSGWGESSDLFGGMADETENQGPNIPKPDRTETRPPEAAQGVRRSQSSQVLSLTHTSEEKKDTKSNNVATLNVGRDPAVKEEKKMIKSNNVATLNVGKDPAVNTDSVLI
jgi:hypothetical protein